jgi:hypothetical protein
MSYTALNTGVVLEMICKKARSACFQVLSSIPTDGRRKIIKNSTRFQENYDELYYRPPDPKFSPRTPFMYQERMCSVLARNEDTIRLNTDYSSSLIIHFHYAYWHRNCQKTPPDNVHSTFQWNLGKLLPSSTGRYPVRRHLRTDTWSLRKIYAHG